VNGSRLTSTVDSTELPPAAEVATDHVPARVVDALGLERGPTVAT
jgi:hypothetical protein